MRILWFSNAQIVGSVRNVGCSWIGSLEEKLSKVDDISLGVVFLTKDTNMYNFSVGNRHYYPVIQKPFRSKIHELIFRLKHKLQIQDNINHYLKIIENFKPDVIHIFGTESDFGLIVNKTNVPCVIHIQGVLNVIIRKWFSGLTFWDILKYSNKNLLLRGHGFLHDYYICRRAVEREAHILLNCRYLMGRTDWDRRLSEVLSPNSVYFNCEEILRPAFYSQQWKPNQPGPDYSIISIIKNNIYKGLETILETSTLLQKNFHPGRITWKVAGIKEDDEFPYLVQRKFKCKLKDLNIILLGRINEEELIPEMLKSNLFVHPSHIENSPNSVCEAMLLGMPIVATYAGGTSSILKNDEEGFLVQDGDPFGLAGAIIELIRKPMLANEFSLNARKKAMERHNPSQVVDNVLSIYRSII